MPILPALLIASAILWIAYKCIDAYARHRYSKRMNAVKAEEARCRRMEEEKKKQAAAAQDSLPYPTPSLKPHGVSILDLNLGGTFPKYRYTDVSIRYADEVFKQLPPYSFFSLMYVNDSAVILYFDTNDNPVVVALLQNQKMIDMVHDWTERNWTCHAQVSASGESIDLAFWDHE